MPLPISHLASAVLQRKKGSSTVLEYRALISICGALEVQNWKAALLACAKQIKTKPDHSIVRALKAAAITGPRPLTVAARLEAQAEIDYIKSQPNAAGLADPEVLLVLGWVLEIWEGERNSEFASLMHMAVVKHPENEHVNTEALLYFVKMGNYAAAHRVSFNMAQLYPRSPHYFFWLIALSNLLRRSHDPALDQHTADFTQLILTKNVFVGSSASSWSRPNIFESAHEFFVVTRYLELRAKESPDDFAHFKDETGESKEVTAREMLWRHLGSPVADEFCSNGLGLELWRREIELREGGAATGEWKKSWQRMKTSLEEGDINWHTMLYMIRCAFALADDSSAAYAVTEKFTPRSEPTPEGLTLISETRQLLRQFSEGLHASSAPNERGYLLGALEIARENRRRNWPNNNGAEELPDLILEYGHRFRSKICCFDDLHGYLEALDEEEIRRIKTDAETKSRDDAPKMQTEQAALALINAYKVARYLSTPVDADSQLTLAHAYLTRYFEVLPLGSHLDSTDLQPADDFAILAVEAFVSAHGISHDRSHLESALLVLDYALNKSQHKYQLRLLAINIQRMLGASSLALKNYKALGLKSIQQDTLLHVIGSRAATFANAIASRDPSSEPGVMTYLKNAIAWWENATRESSDMIVNAFTVQNYSKIEDFCDFEERLRDSVSIKLAWIESYRLHILEDTAPKRSYHELMKVLAERMKDENPACDNRDYKTIPNLQGKTEKSIWEQTSLGPKQGWEWMRAMASIYARCFESDMAFEFDKDADELLKSEELSPPESALLQFSLRIGQVLTAPLDNSEPEDLAFTFFKGQHSALIAAIEDPGRLPWEVLSIAQIAFEGYCLFDSALMIYNGVNDKKTPEQAKHTKRLKNYRTKCREATQKIGKEIATWSKKVAKEKNKIISNVANLKQFEKFDDDVISNWAGILAESRKSYAEALGAMIHKRCIK